jgi:predicted N-formylglutamate amidohydrolase
MHESHEIISGALDGGLLIVADHASKHVPEDYDGLGLAPGVLQRHVGYDIGVRDVVLHLAHALGAPAVLSRFSRLLIDPNRGLDDPTLVMRLSDGDLVPGNARHDAEERQRRIDRFWKPYDDAIGATLRQMAQTGVTPCILSVHSFTPVWRGRPRPWHAGILWDRDPRLARLLLNHLARDPTLVVGDNEPYDGALRGDCMHRHGTANGYAHAIVEIRQDLVATPEGTAGWAARLAALMDTIRREPALHRVEHFGSRTDR